MATYIFDRSKGCMVDKATGEPMLTETERNQPVQAPRVFGDLQGYQSPIDGKWVEGRRARKYDMESNGCIDANDISPAGGRKLKNERFVEKHNLQHLTD